MLCGAIGSNALGIATQSRRVAIYDARFRDMPETACEPTKYGSNTVKPEILLISHSLCNAVFLVLVINVHQKAVRNYTHFLLALAQYKLAPMHATATNMRRICRYWVSSMRPRKQFLVGRVLGCLHSASTRQCQFIWALETGRSTLRTNFRITRASW